jgi:hypothetical protein
MGISALEASCAKKAELSKALKRRKSFESNAPGRRH